MFKFDFAFHAGHIELIWQEPRTLESLILWRLATIKILIRLIHRLFWNCYEDGSSPNNAKIIIVKLTYNLI